MRKIKYEILKAPYLKQSSNKFRMYCVFHYCNPYIVENNNDFVCQL